jgi:DNA-binding MarR family transcriptional regulator
MDMKSKTLDSITENLLYIIPILHKKILKIDTATLSCDLNLSRLHIGILGLIHENKTIPISEIAKQCLVPKPQMTLLINQLVKSAMVERHPNTRDRRVSDITLTPKGRAVLKCSVQLLETNIKEKLSYLDEGELEDLSHILIRLRNLGAKLENQET